jgi:hypothetical protein
MTSTFQWQSCASGRCVSVVGEKKPVYVLGADDAGFTIRAVVQETNAAGTATAYSARSAPVVFRGVSPPPAP